MSDFIQIPASKKSFSNRKLIYGVGINDADYMIMIKSGRSRIMCPFYSRWSCVLSRVLSESFQKTKPTYKGCTLSEEWLVFSSFRKWMIQQDWEGNDLDKDILFPGNRNYGPDECAFVSRRVNELLCNRGKAAGKYKKGVRYYRGKYVAAFNIGDKNIYLGTFNTEEEASQAYNKGKAEEIIKVSKEQTDPRVTEGLLRHARLILGDN